MKISVIGPVYPYRGGIAHYTSALAGALQARGHEIQVVSFKRQYPSILYPGETDKDASAVGARFPAQYLLDPVYPWTWSAAARALAVHTPQLVIIQWWVTFWGPAFASLAGMLHGDPPVVYLIHNVYPHESRPWDRWLAQLALRQGQGFIVQAPSQEQRLLELIPAARIVRCSHPVYAPFGQHPIARETARAALGLPLDVPVLLFFGIVRPYKGLKVLLEAIATAGARVHLLVAGEFWEQIEPYRQQIEELGIGDRVTLIARYIPNEEAHTLFSAADGLVAPYVGGTQSGAVQLALGYGLPIILSDRIAAGLPEEKTTSAKIVPAGDARSLAAALADVATELSRGRRPAPATDDWGKMVDTIEHLANEIHIGAATDAAA